MAAGEKAARLTSRPLVWSEQQDVDAYKAKTPDTDCMEHALNGALSTPWSAKGQPLSPLSQ